MTYIFESGLAHHIEGLIQQKRADGYAYNSEEKLLKRFDTFCVQNYPELTTVTYEMAAKWSEARPGEGDAYHNRRMSMVKVLSEYILSLGQEAYIPNFFCKAYRPVLYIPSKEEVKELLQKMDIRTSHNSEQFRLDRECKILFLLYFCCGLRLSEGRLLKWEHIDLDKGILTVLGSKGNKDRLVYLPQDSLPVLKNYKERQEMLFPGIDWAFPGKDPHKPVSCSGVESSFNRHWAMLPVAKTIDKQIQDEVEESGIHGSGITVSNFIKMVENQTTGKKIYSHAELRRVFGVDRQIRLSDISGGISPYTHDEPAYNHRHAADHTIKYGDH